MDTLSKTTSSVIPQLLSRQAEKHVLKASCTLHIVLYCEQQQDKHTKSHVPQPTCNKHCVLVGRARASLLLTVGSQSMLRLAPFDHCYKRCMHYKTDLHCSSRTAASSMRFPVQS